MASKRRRPQPGGDCGTSEIVLADGFDTLRFNPESHKKQAHRRRAGFARGIVFEVFGYRNARAIDYDGFVDRKPNPAPLWWRAAS